MNKSIRFLFFSLAPIAVTMAYSIIFSFVSDYANRHFNIFIMIFAVLMGYILIGVTLFLICKPVLKQKESVRIPYELLIGILLSLIPTIYYFLPVEFPLLINLAYSIGMPISGLFIGVYICLFVVLLSRRAKALKARTAEQDNEPQ